MAWRRAADKPLIAWTNDGLFRWHMYVVIWYRFNLRIPFSQCKNFYHKDETIMGRSDFYKGNITVTS